MVFLEVLVYFSDFFYELITSQRNERRGQKKTENIERKLQEKTNNANIKQISQRGIDSTISQVFWLHDQRKEKN